MSGAAIDALLARATRDFENRGINCAALEARLLLEGATGLDHAALVARGSDVVTPETATRFQSFVRRRLDGEPVFRILGHRWFHGFKLALSAATLEPRDDTESLVDVVVDELRRRGRLQDPLQFADLGTGTGAIALALLSELPAAAATATDISDDALRTAALNAAENGLSARFSTVLGNWFEPLGGQFDFIVSNPPYIASDAVLRLPAEVRDHDPRRALDGGADGLDAHIEIISAAPRYLREGGFVAIEIGFDQAAVVKRLAHGAGWRDITVHRDLSGNDRVVMLRC